MSFNYIVVAGNQESTENMIAVRDARANDKKENT